MSEIFNFRQWILDQKSELYELVEESEEVILLKTDYATGKITVYRNINLVEFHLISKKNGEVAFYLHFQLKDPEHAKELFHEMVHTLNKLKDKQTLHILIACSSGLTTNYFADILNKGADLLANDYVFKAVSFSKLADLGNKFDAIGLAPQVGYLENELKDLFPDIPVFRFPADVYGAYEVGQAIDFVNQQFTIHKLAQKEENTPFAMKQVDTDRKILTIGMLFDNDGMRILYRVYENGMPKHSSTVLKEHFTIYDLTDVIDTVLSLDREIDAICISIPGILNNGRIHLARAKLFDFDLMSFLQQRYSQHFVLCNNANAIALGLYATNSKYSSVVYHSQPIGGSRYAGEGIVIHGKLIEGRNGAAGELQYLFPALDIDDATMQSSWKPEVAAKVIAKVLLSPISTIAPDAIFIRCRSKVNMNVLKQELLKVLPEEYIPDLFYIRSIEEYLFFGQLMVCVEEMNHMK